MSTKSRSASSRRSREERFLRYILRRKQCYVLLLMEFIVLITLILILLLFFWFARNETKEMEIAKIENSWKKSEQHKLNFYKCEYEPIWEHPEQMNHDLCNNHFGKGAQVWTLQKTLTNSTTCIHKIHMVPCHNSLLEGEALKIYDNERAPPSSCGGVFDVPLPYEHITPETEIRAPQVTNEMLAKTYMNQNVIATALHVKCPRCSARSNWYAAPIALRCRRQLVTVRKGWPYIAKYCDLEQETELNLEKLVYC